MSRGEVVNYDIPNPLSLESDKTDRQIQFSLPLAESLEVKTCNAKLAKRFEFDKSRQFLNVRDSLGFHSTRMMQGGQVDNSTYLQTILSQTTRGLGERHSISVSKGP